MRGVACGLSIALLSEVDSTRVLPLPALLPLLLGLLVLLFGWVVLWSYMLLVEV